MEDTEIITNSPSDDNDNREEKEAESEDVMDILGNKQLIKKVRI